MQRDNNSHWVACVVTMTALRGAEELPLFRFPVLEKGFEKAHRVVSSRHVHTDRAHVILSLTPT